MIWDIAEGGKNEKREGKREGGKEEMEEKGRE